MLRRLLGVAAALAFPALLAAQTPRTPNTEASATAKERTTLHGKATQRRGEVVHKDQDDRAKGEGKDRDRDDRPKGEDMDHDRDDGTKVRNPNAATPAIPAVPTRGEGPAKPAIPAVPAHKGKP